MAQTPFAAVSSPELRRAIRAEQRRHKRRKVYAKLAENFTIYAIVLPLRALWLMLAVGVAHGEWIHTLPTIGYWWSMLLVALLTGVFSPIDYKTKSTGEKS